MRGFQKGITLSGRTSGSALKVMGGWWVVGGPLDFSVTQVQVFRLYFEFKLDLTWTRLELDLDWTWTGLGLSLDNFPVNK